MDYAKDKKNINVSNHYIGISHKEKGAVALTNENS